jgi:hypothetical protein
MCQVQVCGREDFQIMGKGPAMITSLAKVENGKDAWRAAA